jgi:lysine 6-dehydrogenase
MVANVLDKEQLLSILDQVDIVVAAVTHSFELSNAITLACIESKKSMVDMCPRGWDERMKNDQAAKDANVQILIGLGVAPGLSNIMMAYAASKMDQIESGVIRCGGLPQDYPVPPLDYRITFGFEGLNFLYLRTPMVVKDGKITKVGNMSDLEDVEYPRVGKLEAFNTDGLTTLAITMQARGIKNLFEKTIRRPGHSQKIRLLIEMGLWDDQPVMGVIPRQYLAEVLKPKLTMKPEHRELTILHVNSIGKKDGAQIEVDLLTIDYFDEEKGITSMARTTSYPASIAAQMLKKGMIKAHGVTPIEEAFVDGCAEYMFAELKKRGIEITETITKCSVI